MISINYFWKKSGFTRTTVFFRTVSASELFVSAELYNSHQLYLFRSLWNIYRKQEKGFEDNHCGFILITQGSEITSDNFKSRNLNHGNKTDWFYQIKFIWMNFYAHSTPFLISLSCISYCECVGKWWPIQGCISFLSLMSTVDRQQQTPATMLRYKARKIMDGWTLFTTANR